MSENDPAMARLESVMGVQQAQTAEPVFAQVDNSMLQSIYDACTIYDTKQDGAGNWVRLEKGDLYPRIKRLISALGPLERNTRFQPDEARIAWFDFRHRLRKLRATHRADPYALELLSEIEALRFTVVMGDAYQGHKQTHIQKISGAERKVTVERTGRGSFFGRLGRR